MVDPRHTQPSGPLASDRSSFHWWKKRFKKEGVRILAALAPLLYLSYMHLVRLTSSIHLVGVDEVLGKRARGQDCALAILHQHIVFCPFLFRGLGVSALANVGDAGEIIASILHRCGFLVNRGGSSSRRSRRTPVIRRLIAEARRDRGSGFLMAFTPDGSRGPAGACKGGVALFAIKTGCTIYCVNIHARRALYAPTWDRTMVPLPFNEIRVEVEGPIRPDPALPSHVAIEACRQDVERTLHKLHRAAFARLGRRPLPLLVPLVPGAPARDRREQAE